MTKTDIIRKLTSRKLWLAIAGFVTGLLVYFGKSDAEASQIAALIMSAASCVAYILGEGLIDAASAGQDMYIDSAVVGEELKPPEEE